MVTAAGLAAGLAFAPGAPHAQEAPEKELLAAMSYSAARGDRLKQPGGAIRAYIKAGYVPRKPDKRMDYTDYRVLTKPASLLGHRLVVVEEEYLTKYIGCCVNEGVGAIVQVEGDDSALRSFAKQNKCSLDEKYVAETMQNLGLGKPEGRFVSVSCRFRDAAVD